MKIYEQEVHLVIYKYKIFYVDVVGDRTVALFVKTIFAEIFTLLMPSLIFCLFGCIFLILDMFHSCTRRVSNVPQAQACKFSC